MFKKILTTGILFLILATSVAPVGAGAAPVLDSKGNCILNCTDATNLTSVPNQGANIGTGTGGISGLLNSWPLEYITNTIGWILQRISSLALILSGLLFDKIVDVTVVNMSNNVGIGTSIGTSIQQSWTTLRDIANMVFIFVLLYTAFNYMFSVGAGNVGRNIAMIIIVALVINFSLFFSKVVIDASNVLSLGFYRAISSAGKYEINLKNGNQATTTSEFDNSISGGYMRMLGIHSFFSPTANISGAHNILIVGILSSIFMLITSVILLIAGIMFAARFVILIFLMILSPVAFVALIIPSMRGKFDEWWKALVNQSFFAPVFFGLTWVVFKVGGSQDFLNGIRTSGGASFTEVVTAPDKALGLIINYVIVIGFSIFALTASKKMASSLSNFASVSAAIGGVAVGGAALLGRNTIGRGAKYISENKRDKWSQSTLGRAGLWTANKTSGASFDARTIGGTGVGKALGLDKGMDALGKAGGKGGFSKSVEEKAKAKVDYAKKVYGQTARESELSKTAESEYNKLKLGDEVRIKEQREAEIKKNEEEIEKIQKEIEENENNAKASSGSLEKQKEYNDKIKESRNRLSQIKNINSLLKNKNKDNKFDDAEYNEETIKKKVEWESNKDAGKRRMKEFAERIKRGPLGIGFIGKMQGNQEAARKIIEAAEGKDKKKPKDLMKELGKLVGVDDEEKDKSEEGKTEENKTDTDNNKA